MDHTLTAAFGGLTLHHGPAHLYRALIEASACGVRWIVDLLREHGVPVTRFVATGGLPHHNPLITHIYAGVLGEEIAVHPCKHGPALGAAILGALAAGLFAMPGEAISAMAPACTGETVRPRASERDAYEAVYRRYRSEVAARR